MSNLLASFQLTGNTLDVFQQALDVTQNNVSNSSTPGYAKQTLNLAAQPFDITSGLAGGVAARGLEDSRDQYAEEDVQRQTQTLGYYSAQAQATGTIQGYFDVTGNGGVSAALNSLFQSFSAWSTTPNDSSARQAVLAAAGNVASAISGLATSLNQTSQNLDGQIGTTVSQINSLAAQIQQYNIQRAQSSTPDPGADANLHNALDQLAGLVNYTTINQPDGTVTVLVGGGSPLVVGSKLYQLTSGTSTATDPPSAQILDWQNKDITAETTGGQLGGLLDARNRVLGGMLGNGVDPASINQFARSLADTVNGMMTSGFVSADPGAANGAALFTYNATDPSGIAASLAVDPAATSATLAPVDASGNASGNALALAGLANSTSIDGMSLPQYYARMASEIGQENQTATTNQSTQQSVVTQSKSLRDSIQGVSLDGEAVDVLRFQRAYQAAAQVLTVLNSLADTTLNLIPQQ
jgi:flagellar hook-associated protein 1 FlgK